MAAEETFGFVGVVTEDLKQIKATLKEQGTRIDGLKDVLNELKVGAKDVSALHGIVGVAQTDINILRDRLSELREKELVQGVNWTAQIAANENNIANLKAGIGRLTWLIISTIVSGLISGTLIYVFHVLGK